MIPDEIENELTRQVDKWGVQDHNPWHWLVILMEEVGEASHAICGKSFALDSYREELIHIAAVAQAAAESYDRQKEKENEP